MGVGGLGIGGRGGYFSSNEPLNRSHQPMQPIFSCMAQKLIQPLPFKLRLVAVSANTIE